jgi:FlaA1/EpsC-like NDP-sugar epimerase
MHPHVARFFMTIPEAVRLVIQAAAIGRPGEAFVLDMGDPVRIADIAQQLTLLAGRPVQILYTGLRNGEKLHEELFGDGEIDDRPVHPAVFHVAVPSLDPVWLRQPVSPSTAGEVIAQIVQAPDTEMAVERVPSSRPPSGAGPDGRGAPRPGSATGARSASGEEA